jgi:putative PIN family toxin of toxin-antitoxin system
MPKNKSLRLIIDTNLWISFLISDNLHKLDKILYTAHPRLIFSEELLNEISKTIEKPKLSKFFSSLALENMLLALQSYIDIIVVESEVNVCRDAKDNFLLALSKDSKADYLLTGDKDLLQLEKFENTRIVTITEFFEKTGY